MAIQQKLYTVDDLWALESDPEFEHRKFYLIDGILYEDDVPGRIHALLAIEIGFHLRLYAGKSQMGEATSECGFHPPEKRYTALLPDVAYQRFDQLPDPPPKDYVPKMPDLAVEIKSPSDTMSKLRQKARAYLENGTIHRLAGSTGEARRRSLPPGRRWRDPVRVYAPGRPAWRL